MNESTSNDESSKHLYFDDLFEGMSAQVTNVVTEETLVRFAQVSGDTNPVHLDADYAAQTRFKQRIAHGMLSASFVSAVFGTRLPGPGCIYVNQALRFKAPVHIGDEVITKVVVTNKIPEKGFVEFQTQCLVDDELVLDGEATLWVPGKPAVPVNASS